jgi:hypothetical protein
LAVPAATRIKNTDGAVISGRAPGRVINALSVFLFLFDKIAIYPVNRGHAHVFFPQRSDSVVKKRSRLLSARLCAIVQSET